jgi:hypothetical protein
MDKKCKQCETTFTVDSKTKRKIFCSHSCAAKFNNRGVKRHGESSVDCIGCGTSIRASYKNGYCSTKCRQDHEIIRWLAGELDGDWKYTYASYVKRYLEKKTNCSCEECGFDKRRKDGSHILQVDHIDGNWRNNSPGNVRLLCPNCHGLTDTWGAANMGNGRAWKKEYNQFSRKK